MNRFQVEYSETNKETKHTLGQDCWSYLDRRANEGEREQRKKENHKELPGSYSKGSGPVKNKNGNEITSENLKHERWPEHFTQVLNRPKPTETATVDENFGDQLDIELKIKKTINKLKNNNKAPGIDSLESELT